MLVTSVMVISLSYDTQRVKFPK